MEPLVAESVTLSANGEPVRIDTVEISHSETPTSPHSRASDVEEGTR